MNAEENDTTPQQPDDEQAAQHPKADSKADSKPDGESSTSESSPIDLEPLDVDRSTIRDLDVCPNCGASLPSDDDVVCMRCGFDLRTLQSLETKAEQARDDDEDEDDQLPADPIASSNRPLILLSGALIATSWVLLIIGYFLGVGSLMPGAELRTIGEGDDVRAIIPPMVRLLSFLKVLVLSGTWVICATAGLAMFARLAERRFGDLRAALLHLAAIVSTMQLVRYFGVGTRSIEWTLEAIAQIIVFLGLSLVLLKLDRRDVVTFSLITIIVLLSLFFGSHVMTWAMSS